MANIIEWTPLIAIIISVIGSVASFIFSIRQRRQDVKLVEAQTTETIGIGYKDLLSMYQQALTQERESRREYETKLQRTEDRLEKCMEVVSRRYDIDEVIGEKDGDTN